MVTWEQHRRTRELSHSLGIPLTELCYTGSGISRYVVLTCRTVLLLLRTKPRVLFVQNPSIVLAMVAVLLRPLFRYQLVVDAHNEAVQPYINCNWPVPEVARWLLARADITIVTNESLAKIVREAQGSPHVLPDCLPKPPPLPPRPSAISQPFSIMVISTYAEDEPIAEIMDAARSLGPEYRFHFTGNDRRLPDSLRKSIPDNVVLTGFLPEDEYWFMMNSCDVVLDLTLMPDCLVCGAYEALSIRKPMILSQSEAARELFAGACILTTPDAGSIATAVRTARTTHKALSSTVSDVAVQFVAGWERRAEALIDRLEA